MQLELIDNNNHRSAANSLSLVLQGRTKPMRNDICGMHAWSTNTVPIHSGLTRTRATVLVKSKTISIRCVHTMSVCMLYMLCVCVCVACSVWWHCHANQSASFSNNLISSSFLFSARVECEMVKHWTCNASRASNVAFSSFFFFSDTSTELLPQLDYQYTRYYMHPGFLIGTFIQIICVWTEHTHARHTIVQGTAM